MVNILVCGNRDVFDGMMLTALSIIKHTAEPIRLFIGTMDLSDVDDRFLPISETDRSYIEMIIKSKNQMSEAHIIDFGENFRRELMDSKNINTGYTPYAMIRLFADECDELPDKLIYLDTDVLLSGDISELYDIDISGYELAGVRDHYGKVFIYPNYLNSGVLLLNLSEIRKSGSFRRAVRMCRDKKMLLMDQTAINKCARGKKLIIPRRFNEQHKNRRDTLIRHFSMRIRWFPYFRTEKIKPWDFDLIHDKLKLYEYDDIFEEFIRLKFERVLAEIN